MITDELVTAIPQDFAPTPLTLEAVAESVAALHADVRLILEAMSALRQTGEEISVQVSPLMEKFTASPIAKMLGLR